MVNTESTFNQFWGNTAILAKRKITRRSKKDFDLSFIYKSNNDRKL